MGNAGNLLQVQFERFVDQQFVEASVFAEDERVVETGDQKNVLDLEGHQVVETFEARFGVEEGLGDGVGGHEGYLSSCLRMQERAGWIGSTPLQICRLQDVASNVSTPTLDPAWHPRPS